MIVFNKWYSRVNVIIDYMILVFFKSFYWEEILYDKMIELLIEWLLFVKI